jgi:hypothetical protein
MQCIRNNSLIMSAGESGTISSNTYLRPALHKGGPCLVALNYELTNFQTEWPGGQPLAICLRAGSGCFLVQSFTSDRKLLYAPDICFADARKYLPSVSAKRRVDHTHPVPSIACEASPTLGTLHSSYLSRVLTPNNET